MSAWIVFKAAAVLAIVLLAAILSSGMAPIAQYVGGLLRGRARRSVSFAIAYLLVLIVIGGSLGYYGYLVSDDVRGVASSVPQILASLKEIAAYWHARYPWLPEPGALLASATDRESAATYFSRAYAATVGAVGIAWGAITVVILSYYMSIEAITLRSWLLALLPESQRLAMERDLRRLAAQFGRYVRGQLFVSSTMGVLATLGSAAIGLHFPFLIGAWVALSDFIPLVGGVVGSIPAIAIALTQQRWQVVAIIVFFVVVQQFENNILIPRVMRAAVGISPVLTLVAVMIGATAFGVPGALLAIPIAAGLQVAAPVVFALARGEYGDRAA